MTSRQVFITAITALVGAIVFVWYQDWHDRQRIINATNARVSP